MRRRSWIVVLALASTLSAGCSGRAIRPPAAEAPLVPCRQADCLRVVAWNVHALPFFSPNPAARLANVAAKLREQQPDLVLLQEIWTHTYARRLARALADDYRLTTGVGCGRPFPCGGLGVLVRIGSGWVASAPTFVPFDATAPWYRFKEWDYLAKKGMLLLHLARGDEALGVVDTHLQTEYARHGRNYSDVRRRQLEQLAWTLEASFDGRPVIVGGDLNTAPGERSGLYATHVAVLGDDHTAAFRAACGGCGTRPPAVKPGRWLDYVMSRRLTATATLARLANEAVDRPFSDHDGLLVRLEYTPGALRAPTSSAPCTAPRRPW